MVTVMQQIYDVTVTYRKQNIFSFPKSVNCQQNFKVFKLHDISMTEFRGHSDIINLLRHCDQ